VVTPEQHHTHHDGPQRDVNEGHKVAQQHGRQREREGGVEARVALLEEHAHVLQLRAREAEEEEGEEGEAQGRGVEGLCVRGGGSSM
jgi:hypothetical protein